MNNQNLPELPPGWLGLWDESTQRYYYVEEATGRTQWEFPQQEYNNAVASINPGGTATRGMGEAASYGGGGNSPYPQQQQQNYAPYGQQGQSLGDGQTGDRGMGKIFSGFSGGAITGSLLGYAAGKYFNKHSSHNYQPPPSSGGFGGFSNMFGFGGGHQQNHYGPPGGYGPPSGYGGGYGGPGFGGGGHGYGGGHGHHGHGHHHGH